MDVLLDSAGDQDAKGKRGIVIEEFEGCCDEFLNTLFIDTFVETVDDDEIRIGQQGFGEEGSAGDCLECPLLSVAGLYYPRATQKCAQHL